MEFWVALLFRLLPARGPSSPGASSYPSAARAAYALLSPTALCGLLLPSDGPCRSSTWPLPPCSRFPIHDSVYPHTGELNMVVAPARDRCSLPRVRTSKTATRKRRQDGEGRERGDRPPLRQGGYERGEPRRCRRSHLPRPCQPRPDGPRSPTRPRGHQAAHRDVPLGLPRHPLRDGGDDLRWRHRRPPLDLYRHARGGDDGRRTDRKEGRGLRRGDEPRRGREDHRLLDRLRRDGLDETARRSIAHQQETTDYPTCGTLGVHDESPPPGRRGRDSMANRLASETSPYLLQHKNNPVDWYPWGEEALKRAREEDKPVLLSVGYSACHWCHVMERESFEDDETARMMNEHFVNIKVDREERPDIDSIYMAAVQALTRHGGWPMTVFLTPDGAPFYGGTYFPPVPSPGIPSFQQLLLSVADAYENRREEVLQSAGSVKEFLRASTAAVMPEAGSSGTGLLDGAAEILLSQLDRRFGGFGAAPKFPQAMNLEVLLRHHHRTGDRSALDAVELTLRSMANGGIYDQLGGGFARYSVDAFWLVPHFEKMLYDNALLSRLYLETYQATRDVFYLRIAEETLDYVLRVMTGEEGGFYSAEDADSEGEEGKFYVWTPEE